MYASFVFKSQCTTPFVSTSAGAVRCRHFGGSGVTLELAIRRFDRDALNCLGRWLAKRAVSKASIWCLPWCSQYARLRGLK